MILNVTPKEFNDIKINSFEMNGTSLARYMNIHFGCEYFQSYTIKVRRDVPYIGTFWENLKMVTIQRIENEEDEHG